MIKRYLLAPGPTMVAPETLLAMAQPVLHHRAPEFTAILGRAKDDLKWLYQTRSPVLILASTGTGGMEAAVSNFLSPGDRALVINGGKFGERWLKICQAYGVKTEEIAVEWGRAVQPEAVEAALARAPSLKAVYVQASESSTGVAHDVRALGEIVRHRNGTILVVDAVSALGALDLRTDEWGLDVMVSGSQKALGLPPGLAFVSVSEKAWRLAERAKNAKFYFNLKKEREALEKNQTAYTAAVSLIVGLDHVLQELKKEGLPEIFARHRQLARATREGMRAIGLSLYAADAPSDSLTAVRAPEGYDGQEIYKQLRVRYGVTAAGGQDAAKGKIFRIAHMGYCDVFDVVTAVSAVELVLKGMGYPLTLGQGVGAAEEVLLKR